MPENTVYVGRPTIFGNPWTREDTIKSNLFNITMVPEVNVTCFAGWIENGEVQRDKFPLYENLYEKWKTLKENLHLLRGKDLACWCPLDKPCHADVLLELANQ